MPKQRLSKEIQLYIVTHLACYDRPSEVAKAVKETYNVDVPLAHIVYYDATTSGGAKLSAELKTLFHDTRKQFNEDITAVPIANKSYRLRRLQQLLDKHETKGNTVAARDDLELAAKEVGNYFTNKRELTGAGGGPIATQNEALTELAALLGENAAAIAAAVGAKVDG